MDFVDNQRLLLAEDRRRAARASATVLAEQMIADIYDHAMKLVCPHCSADRPREHERLVQLNLSVDVAERDRVDRLATKLSWTKRQVVSVAVKMFELHCRASSDD